MASVFEKYPNLPGFMSEFKDGGLQVRTEVIPPGTESILFLGTAVDGPIGEPVAVDANTVETVFGRATHQNGMPNGSTLVRAFQEAYQGGSRDIRLMRVSGAQASASIKGKAITNTAEEPKAEELGLAPGNAAVVFKLQEAEIVKASVTVTVDGIAIPETAYTIVNASESETAGVTNAEIRLNADVVNANASAYVTYDYVNASGKTVNKVSNGFQDTDGEISYYVTPGTEKVFGLQTVAKASSIKVYANGVIIDESLYVVSPERNSITLKVGAAQRGAQIEATYLNEVANVEQPVVKITSVFGGTVYNQVKVEVASVTDTAGKEIGKKVIITKPESKKGQIAETPLEYTSIDFPSLGLLAQGINADENNNVVRVTVAASHENHTTTDLLATPVLPLTGGADGIDITKQGLYEALGGTNTKPGAYQLLENYNVDMIIPVGAHADAKLAGKYDNFAYQLALACAVISHRNQAVTGLIATSSPDEAGLAGIQAHVEKLLAHKNDYFMRDRSGNILKDSDGVNIDLGRFIQVVAGPDLVLSSSRLGTYASNTVGGYAGYVSQLAAQSSPANKVLEFVDGLRFSYSNKQLDDLTGARYVTFKSKNNGAQVAVTDSPTAAQPGSDYRRLTTMRVVKEVVNEIRDVADTYIGEPNEIAQRNAMAAAISKRLDALREAGVIIGHDFTVVATEQMQLMGEAQIELTVIPPQELRKVTTIVSLRPSN